MLDLKPMKTGEEEDENPDDEEDSRVNKMLERQGTDVEIFRNVVSKMTQ